MGRSKVDIERKVQRILLIALMGDFDFMVFTAIAIEFMGDFDSDAAPRVEEAARALGNRPAIP